MPTSDEFRAELRSQLRAAELKKLPHADINAGELHRCLGGYPGANLPCDGAGASCAGQDRRRATQWKGSDADDPLPLASLIVAMRLEDWPHANEPTANALAGMAPCQLVGH